VRVTTPDGALVATPIVADVARDAHGRVVAATLGNGVGQTWAYDPASGRLVAQDAVRLTRAYQGLRCTYDPDGKLVRMLDVAQDGPGALVPGAVSARRDFGYDAHGRLVEATGRVHQALLPHDGPTTAGCVHGARHLSLNNGAALERYTQRFSYDAGGNLTRVQHAGTTASWATDYWVAAGSNRATPAEDGNGVPVVDPAGMFDAGGNLRELWHLRAMGWSWRGCLTHATTVARPSGPVDDGERYAYGADRVRVRKVATRLVVGGAEPVVETREVVYCGGGQERVRVARNGTLVLERWTTHVSDGDRRVAVIDRHVVDTLANEVDAIGPARVRYHLTTPQGSTAVELDEAGLLVSYEEYLPHGGSAFIAGDDVREVARRDVRYAGKERDRATGLDAYPQRYYAPWLGRWLSPDPIGPKDGLNLYAFVGGDPVGYVDPEGTDRRAADEECRSRGTQIGRGDPAVGHQAAPPARASAAPRFLAPVQPESFQPFVPPLLREPQGSGPSMADGASGSDTAKSTADVGLFDPFGWFAGSTAGTDTTAESDPASAIDPVDYEALFPVEPAAFAYDQARIEQAEAARTSAWATLLRDPDALDRLRYDAEIPHSPAAFVWDAALDFMRYSGAKLAEDTEQVRCLVPGLREASSSDCVKKWDELDKLLPSAKEGPSRLREALLDSYEARALELASRNQLIGSAANAVLSVLALRSALRVETVQSPAPRGGRASGAQGIAAEVRPGAAVATPPTSLATSPLLAAEHGAGGQSWYQALPKPLRDKVAEAQTAAQAEFGRGGRIVASDRASLAKELDEVKKQLESDALSGKQKKALRLRKQEIQEQLGQTELGQGPVAAEVPVPTQFKERVSGLSGKEAATDKPSWIDAWPDGRPGVGESGTVFATRMMDKKYGLGGWDRVGQQGTEFSQLKKFGDRAFR
jgi:RHS repeat-associated protein